jgi:hypothetical protein
MHEVWHALVLGSTLFAAAGAVILALSPVFFEPQPAGLTRSRKVVLGLIGLAIVLLIVEWTVVHPRSGS